MFLLKTLLIFHTLGDYYFQSNKLSKLKNDNFLFVVLHSLPVYNSICSDCLDKHK